MSRCLPLLLALGIAAGFVAPAVFAQDPPPPKGEKIDFPKPPLPAATAVAATVNGEKILELAVYRALLKEDPKHRDSARKEVVSYLVDNLLIDQYLRQLKVPVEPKEIEDRMEQIKAEIKKEGGDYKKQLDELLLTDADVRTEIGAALRWDKFVVQQGTDKVLTDLFEKNKVMFNGTQVQARHILISTKELAAEKAKAKAEALKKEIEAQVAEQLAKMPPGADKTALEKERMAALDKAFSVVATRDSACTATKAAGGDLDYFPRVGAMVEPFARTAFSLKAFEMSEPVQTEFGYHLILTTDWKMGRDVKFEEVKSFVMEVYAERLRDAVINAYKPRSKIETTK